MSVCKALTRKGGYIFYGRYDMCAGLVKKFKTNHHIIKNSDGTYKMGEKVTNYFGINKNGDYPYDFYVGGSDACSGDSGGGLYTWRPGDKFPTLIGELHGLDTDHL